MSLSRKGAERGNRKLRVLDQYFGPLILFFLKIFYLPLRNFCRRVRDIQGSPVRSIALTKFAGVGDLVLLSGVLTDLRRAFPAPHHRITLFVGKENESYAKLLQGYDELVCVAITSPRSALRQMRERPFDLVFNFESWSRWAAILTTLMQAQKVVGFRTPGQWRHLCDDASVLHRGDVHEFENDRALVQHENIPTRSPPQKVADSWQNRSQRTIIFHLWASGRTARTREWAFDHWVTLLEKIPPVFSVLLTGGPADFPRAQEFLRALPPSLHSRVSLKLGLSWQGVVELMLQSRAVIVGDTGIAHIAGIHEVPTVVLFGPSQPRRWAPLGKRVECVFHPKPDARFLSLGFEHHPQLNTMATIEADEVYARLEKLGVFQLEDREGI